MTCKKCLSMSVRLGHREIHAGIQCTDEFTQTVECRRPTRASSRMGLQLGGGRRAEAGHPRQRDQLFEIVLKRFVTQPGLDVVAPAPASASAAHTACSGAANGIQASAALTTISKPAQGRAS